MGGLNFGVIGSVVSVLFILSALINLLGSTLYVEKSGFIIIEDEKWAGMSNGSVGKWLGKRDSRLEHLSDWGERQLVPRWTSRLQGLKGATIVDLRSNIQSRFVLRDWPGRKANALVPIAVHGCGITCLVLHHFDDKYRPAIKLGIVNMPPYALNQGTEVGSLEVGAVPIDPPEPPRGFIEGWFQALQEEEEEEAQPRQQSV
jgi:hypothetical protein